MANELPFVTLLLRDTGVTTTVLDRLTGAQYSIRSKYLIGADGARSKVADYLGLPFEGPGRPVPARVLRRRARPDRAADRRAG